MVADRCRGDRGAGLVTVLVLVFSATSATVFWLAGEVDRSLSHRSSAQLVAYEAARSGAQQIDIDVLRGDGEIRVDLGAVATASDRAAAVGFERLGLNGSVVSVQVDDRLVTVEVEIVDAGRSVRGRAAAEAEVLG
jgi:hypothetical protein